MYLTRQPTNGNRLRLTRPACNPRGWALLKNQSTKNQIDYLLHASGQSVLTGYRSKELTVIYIVYLFYTHIIVRASYERTTFHGNIWWKFIDCCNGSLPFRSTKTSHENVQLLVSISDTLALLLSILGHEHSIFKLTFVESLQIKTRCKAGPSDDLSRC